MKLFSLALVTLTMFIAGNSAIAEEPNCKELPMLNAQRAALQRQHPVCALESGGGPSGFVLEKASQPICGEAQKELKRLDSKIDMLATCPRG